MVAPCVRRQAVLRQEINLSHPQDVGSAVRFLTFNKFKLCLYIFSAFLALIYFYTYATNLYLYNQSSKLQNNIEKLQKNFYQLKETYPQLVFSKDLDSTVSKLKSDIQAQNEMLKSLVQKDDFSTDLIQLSELIIPDVWLTKIELNDEENKDEISGKSTSIDSIQQFASSLQKRGKYKNKVINVDNIQEPDKSVDSFSFTISIQNLKHE